METLRDFLDAILDFIGSESMTDLEYATIPVDLAIDYTLESYNALKGVLESREEVSGQGKRLKLYYIAKGVELNNVPANSPNSNILIGGAL